MSREIVNGYYAHSREEIAEKLGLSINQVQYALESGLQKLAGSPLRDFEDLGHWEYRYNCKLYGDTPWRTTDLT